MGNRTATKPRKKYQHRPMMREFESMDGGPIFFDPADVRSIRPAAGDWTNKAALVCVGQNVPEMAIKGRASDVARMIAEMI